MNDGHFRDEVRAMAAHMRRISGKTWVVRRARFRAAFLAGGAESIATMPEVSLLTDVERRQVWLQLRSIVSRVVEEARLG
ncbi:MAG: hypothetical protein AAF532_03675 [Planctomycetota bacterium]